jgi:hypothetical protein
MRAIRMTRRRGISLLAGAAVAVSAGGCGEDDFPNDPRPPVPEELTGVIQTDKVTVSPDGRHREKLQGGPFLITISNQTDDPHTVTLEGEQLRVRTDEIQPLDTATIQRTLTDGTYQVRAGSSTAQRREIAPAVLVIRGQRKSSNDELLLP